MQELNTDHLTESIAKDNIAPISKDERITELDALRGFAILGILLMNIEYFTTPFYDMMIGMKQYQGVDAIVDLLTGIFVENKFWTMFSLLFGMGFAVMQLRAQKAGISFKSLYAKRTAWLLVIGIVHAFFIWAGDILIPYAIGGFILLLAFRETKTSRLWKYALGIFGVLLLLTALSGSEVTNMTLEEYQSAGVTSMEDIDFQNDANAEDKFMYYLNEQANKDYGSGSYLEVTKRRVIDNLLFLTFAGLGLIPLVLSVFLFGAWLIKSGIMQRPKEHLSLFRKIFWLGLPVGVVLAYFSQTGFNGLNALSISEEKGIHAAAELLAGAILCMAYVSGLILWMSRGNTLIERLLAPVGRMALTNYLLQSLVFSTIFYGYGLAQWDQISRTNITLMAIGFYILQIFFSKWWMSKHRYGPMEWVWRRLTYGKLISKNSASN